MAWALAERALRGVGDASAGEWRERGSTGVCHILRRLTEEERMIGRRDPLQARDIRGTDEEQQKIPPTASRCAPHAGSCSASRAYCWRERPVYRERGLMALSTRRIPANVLAAARRAGLKVPDWYVGALIDPDKPRKKTLADITEQVRREEREACEPPNPDVPSEPSESSGRGRSVSREFDALVECQYHGDRDQAGTDRVVEAAKAALAIWDRVGRPGMTTTDYSQMADKMANLRAALDA